MTETRAHYFEKKYCIAGTGGCGREALWLLMDVLGLSPEALSEITVFLDDSPSAKEVLGIPVISRMDFNPELYKVVVGIGMPDIRKKFVESLPSNTLFATLIHPSAIISPWAEIGEGSLITARCIVSTQVKLGKFAHLNLGTTISHDFEGGDYFTTAPMASISGNCMFGESVYLGSHASVKQGLAICSHARIGMGAAVVKSILEPGTYVGVPAQKIEKYKHQ